MVDNLAIIPNPNPTGLSTLRIAKEGDVEGLGAWTLGIRSDLVSTLPALLMQFTVGSYVRLDLSFPSIPPTASVYARRLILEEVCEATPIARFNEVGVHGEWTAHPTKEWVLASHGAIPKDVQATPIFTGGHMVWHTEKLRLPGDMVMRPTTCRG